MSDESGFHSLKADLPGGETYDFAELKGKTVLVVNVASQWYVSSQLAYRLLFNLYSGFTPQYKGESWHR